MVKLPPDSGEGGALPGWLAPQATRRRQNARSRSQERQIAREVGGKVQAGSGSSWRAPEDIREETTLIQHKGTENDSFRIELSKWKSTERNAVLSGRQAAWIVEFGDGTRLLIQPYTG